ncbi:hypothetical protein [Xenorhabdus bovienii]|uniref:hypothetical protein n=1 Tax=Xenorhabdus bovienii TaxID=40576 RepID=UPI003DA60A72
MLPVDCRMQSIISVLINSVYGGDFPCYAYNKIYFKYITHKKSFSIESGHPIINLMHYGFIINEHEFLFSEKNNFIEHLKQSQGVVIQHSYSSLLLRMRLIKTGLPVDIPHLIYSNEVNINNNNLIIKTSDEKFNIMSWKHFFSHEDEKITAYFVMQKPEKCIEEDELIRSFRKSIEYYNECYSSDIYNQIEDTIKQDILIQQSALDIPIWNRNIWKMHITRGWFAAFAEKVLKRDDLKEKMLALSHSYQNISEVINQKAIKEQNYQLQPQIDKLMDNLYEEHRIIHGLIY